MGEDNTRTGLDSAGRQMEAMAGRGHGGTWKYPEKQEVSATLHMSDRGWMKTSAPIWADTMAGSLPGHSQWQIRHEMLD